MKNAAAIYVMSAEILFAVAVGLVLYTLAPMHIHAAACLNGYSAITPIVTGYGASYNLFSAGRELLVQGEDCTTTQYRLRVGSTVGTQYVYNQGYHWTGTSWQPFTLTGGPLTSGSWLTAPGQVTINPGSAAYTYAVGYVCHFVDSNWKCGCRDTTCSERYWQLQRVSMGTATGPTCGNAICEVGESEQSCVQDCGGGTGDVKVYPAPTGTGSLPMNPDFTVSVDGALSPVYAVQLNIEHVFTLCVPGTGTWPTCRLHDMRSETGGMTYFDTDGPVTALVTVRNRTVTSARVVPSSYNVTPTVSGNTVTVRLPGPGKYELQVNGESKPLYLFVNPPEINPPSPSDPGVLYFGPGVHSVGRLQVGGTGKKTVYIAGGAIVKGQLMSRDNSNVTIRGRGILDTSGFAVRSGSPVTISNGSNIDLEGFIIHDSSGWTVKLFHLSDVLIDNIKIIGQHRQNADGMDLVNSQRVEVRNVFARVNDDVLVIKGFGDNDDCCEHPQNGKYPPERNSVSDVVFRDSVVTTDLANGTLEIGYELWGNEVKNIRYENIDIIHSFAKSVFGIHMMESNMYAHNISYNNIRVEDYHGGDRGNAWFDFTIKPDGRLTDVTFSNISFTGGVPPRSYMVAPAAPNNIQNVQFRNIRRNGTPITTLAGLGFGSLGGATNVTIVP